MDGKVDLQRAVEVYKNLRLVQEKYKDAHTRTFDLRISDMAKDAADVIDQLLNFKYRLGGYHD